MYVWWFKNIKEAKIKIKPDAFQMVHRMQLAMAYAHKDVTEIRMNVHTYKELGIRDWGFRDFSPCGRRWLLERGYMGDLWDARVQLDKELNDYEVVIIG